MITLPEDLQGLDEGMKALEALEKGETPAPADSSSANDELRAALGEEGSEPTEQKQIQTDTPATTDKPKEGEEPKAADGEKPKSRFEKAQDRLGKSWEQLNQEKQAHTKAIEAERQAIEEQKAQLERQRAEWEASHREPTADEYEAHAGRLLAKVKTLDAEAEKLESDGKYQEAEAKKREAARLSHYAEDAQAAAEQVRKNPPDKARQERAAKIEAARKEWTIKAAVDFPEYGKLNTPVAQAAADILNNLKQSDPDIANHPKAVYFAAELATAQTAAARVSELEKQLSVSKARVAELEALTSPGGGGVAGQPEAPQGDTLESLQTAAREIGHML
jgi:small-conductance mechanosensitive channel